MQESIDEMQTLAAGARELARASKVDSERMRRCTETAAAALIAARQALEDAQAVLETARRLKSPVPHLDEWVKRR